MKKGIVLLITIFFIAAISILILQNLQNTEKYLDTISFDTKLSQTQITMDNIQKEIPKFFKKHKDEIDTLLENTEILPLSFGNVNVLLNIEEFVEPQFDINNLTDQLMAEDDFVMNVNYKFKFKEMVDKRKENQFKYENNKQIQQTIQEYIKVTQDTDILKIKDEFTFIKKPAADTRLIKCNYTLKVDNQNSSEAEFIFDLKSGAVKSFNIISIGSVIKSVSI